MRSIINLSTFPREDHDAAYEELNGLTALSGHPSFTFLDEDVIYGREQLRDLRSWGFGRRLIAAGIQRLEFERNISRDEFDGLLQEILARLTLSTIDTGEARQMRGRWVPVSARWAFDRPRRRRRRCRRRRST